MQREETLLNREVWKQSFLIEIAYDDGDTESFTFSLPPEGITISMSQRVTETPTFGGVFVDDYGIGIGKIRLNGSTGNSVVKKIFRGKQGETWLTGKEEIFYLRDKVIRYKESNKWKRQENPAKINLFNLGTNFGGTDHLRPIEGMGGGLVDAWEVVLKDFTITQSNSKPLLHSYSVDFTAVRVIGESKIQSRAAPAIKKPPDLKWYEKILKALETWYGWSENALRAAQDFRNAINRYSGDVQRYLAMITGSIENYMSSLEKGVYTVTDVYNTFKQVTMAPADSALRLVQSAERMRNAIEVMLEDMKSLPEQWSERYESVGTAVEDEIEAYKSFFEDNMQELENAVNEEYARSTSGANPQAVIIPNTGTSAGQGDNNKSDAESNHFADGTMTILVSYGFMRHIATSETTLERMAAYYLGDPDKAHILAVINGVTGDDEINPGDQIKIPIVHEASLNTYNHIFGHANIRDTMGIDIALDNDGALSVGANDDFVQLVDYENMNQAISMRLSESAGNRIRLNTYGIRNVAGMPDSVALAYIITSIKDTVMQDPRVDKVEDIFVTGAGDALFVSFEYYTYDGVMRRYKGGL